MRFFLLERKFFPIHPARGDKIELIEIRMEPNQGRVSGNIVEEPGTLLRAVANSTL
jgi:hypothetical protein